MAIHNNGIRSKDHFVLDMLVPLTKKEIDIVDLLRGCFPNAPIERVGSVIYIGDLLNIALVYNRQRVRNRAEVVGEEEATITDPETNEVKTVIRRTRQLRQKGGTYFRFYAFEAKDILSVEQHPDMFSITLLDDEFKKFRDSMSKAEEAPPLVLDSPEDPEIRDRMVNIIANSKEIIKNPPAPEYEEEKDPD